MAASRIRRFMSIKRMSHNEELQQILMVLEQNVIDKNLIIAGLQDASNAPKAPARKLEKTLFVDVLHLEQLTENKKVSWVTDRGFI